MKTRRIFASMPYLVSVAVLALSLASVLAEDKAVPADEPAAKVAPAISEATVKLWDAKCKMCHGADGAGNAKMAAAMGGMDKLSVVDEATLEKTDEDLNAVTRDGAGKMPAYKGKISDEDIQALTDYMRSLKK